MHRGQSPEKNEINFPERAQIFNINTFFLNRLGCSWKSSSIVTRFAMWWWITSLPYKNLYMMCLGSGNIFSMLNRRNQRQRATSVKTWLYLASGTEDKSLHEAEWLHGDTDVQRSQENVVQMPYNAEQKMCRPITPYSKLQPSSPQSKSQALISVRSNVRHLKLSLLYPH